jgi:hypothetical protein
MEKVKKIFRGIGKYHVTAFALPVGIFLFYEEYKAPTVENQDDLINIEGRIQNYTFQDKQGARGMKYEYYIFLKDFPCRFQIKADYLQLFNKTKFVENVKIGDSLKVSIPKEIENQIWRNQDVFVLSVSSEDQKFLEEKGTIKKENKNFNVLAGFFS